MNEYSGHLVSTPVVSAKKIAEKLGVKTRTVYQWRHRGLLPDPDVSVSPALWRWSTVEQWAVETGRMTR